MKTVYDLAKEIVIQLASAGYTAYFAGGWVRDYLMDHPSADIDIATDASPQKILDLFPRTILVGLSFGVVIVQFEGHQFEVSTFRKDIEYLNGRKPERVELFSSAEEDASRRDFTINGLFYDPLEEKIYDFVHGIEDIQKKVIRTIGNPFERFIEDRLRMIRAIRFASRFDFFIDQETQEAIIENADTLFPAVAMERVWSEFCKMAHYPRFELALIEMHRLKLLPVVFPHLAGVHLKEIKHRVSIFSHFPHDTPTIVYLMELFPDSSLEEKKELCLYLKTSKKDIQLVEFLENAKQLFKHEKDNGVSDLEWVYFYAHPNQGLCLHIEAARYSEEERNLFLHRHQERKIRLQPHINRVATKQPLVRAKDLNSLGIPPGKTMGTLLKEAEKVAIFYNLQSTEEVLKQMKFLPAWPNEV